MRQVGHRLANHQTCAQRRAAAALLLALVLLTVLARPGSVMTAPVHYKNRPKIRYTRKDG